jgi:hypothetical protein
MELLQRFEQVLASQADGWSSPAAPPAMRPAEDAPYGWPASQPVLARYDSAEMAVVTYEQMDESDPPQWVTSCSERWNVSSRVVAWRPLPTA